MKYLHTALRITNLKDSLDFYCKKLGMVEVRRTKGRHRPCDIIFLAMPDDKQSQIELVYYHNKEDRDNFHKFGHIAYEVENIYNECQRFLDMGMVLTLPPKDGFMAFIQSPDGISFELLQKGTPLKPQEPWLSMKPNNNW